MEHKPEVGDSVVLRGKVLAYSANIGNKPYVSVELENGSVKAFYVSDLTEVIPKPWEPEVGDMVVYGQYDQTLYEYRGAVDGQWVLKNKSNGLFVTDKKDLYTKAP